MKGGAGGDGPLSGWLRLALPACASEVSVSVLQAQGAVSAWGSPVRKGSPPTELAQGQGSPPPPPVPSGPAGDRPGVAGRTSRTAGVRVLVSLDKLCPKSHPGCEKLILEEGGS